MERNYLSLDQIVTKVYHSRPSWNDKKVFLKELTFEILQRIGYKFSLTRPTPVEKLRILLGLDLTFSADLSGDAHSTKKEGGWEIAITSDQVYSDGSQQWLTERGRFSLAHEIAHFILHYIEEELTEIASTLRLSEENAEQLCDLISSELLLPSGPLERASLNDIPALGAGKPLHRESFLLSIRLLENLRKSLNVSRMALIYKLDHTHILDEAECGIIISAFGVNRSTGRSPALRILKASIPSWGFMPENARVSTIGLESAVHAFNVLKYGETKQWKERLRVSERPGMNIGNKWSPRMLDTWGEHALYRFTARQTYLMTTFKWSKNQ
jgi:hypothetical protein